MNEGFSNFFREKRLTITVGDSTETMVATKAVAILSHFVRAFCDKDGFVESEISEKELKSLQHDLRSSWDKFHRIYLNTEKNPSYIDMVSANAGLRELKAFVEIICIPGALDNEMKMHMFKVVEIADALNTLMQQHPILIGGKAVGRG